MNHKAQEFEWQELKDIWTSSPKTKQINIEISALLNQLKSKVSQFEKDSIKSDINMLEASWGKTKGKVSQFEKDLVKKDLQLFTKLFRKFFGGKKDK